jgi:hypothetical protein
MGEKLDVSYSLTERKENISQIQAKQQRQIDKI